MSDETQGGGESEIEYLRGDRDGWRQRAETAEARVAGLERDVRQWQNAHGAAAESFDRIQARLERAYSALDMCLHADESLAELRTVQAVIRDRSSSPQPTATHFACPQRHLDYEAQPEAEAGINVGYLAQNLWSAMLGHQTFSKAVGALSQDALSRLWSEWVDAIRDALPEEKSGPHPDTVRLDFIDEDACEVFTEWDDDRLTGFRVSNPGPPGRGRTIREAIDAAREAESDG